MIRMLLLSLLLGLAATVFGCSDSGESGSVESSATVPGGALTPDETMTSAGPTLPLSTHQLVTKPLTDLIPEVAAYLETRSGGVGIAVVVPAHQAIYSWNGEAQFHMASVAKVVIMLTLMNQAIEQNRSLTPEELSLVEPMITLSDNPTASQLWAQVGGGDAIEQYLQSLGLTGISPNKDGCWGASAATASDTALLFARLALGEILSPEMREIALGFLQQVDPSQTWGVIEAAPGERPEGTIVAVKDGWYPADCGWWVNSAGMLLPSNDKPAYTMAVLTSEQVTWEYGIETIEAVGRMVHQRLHGE